MAIHASFEIRAVEDRQASIDCGGARTKDVEFAVFRVSGDKTMTYEERVTPESLRRWGGLDHLKHVPDAYRAWHDNQEEPVNGMPLKEWPNISPSQIIQAHALNIRTVEEFAELPESGVNAFGIGGQVLKNKAQAYLEAATGPGKVAEQMNAMKAQIQMLVDQQARAQRSLADKDAVIATLIPEEKKTKKA